MPGGNTPKVRSVSGSRREPRKASATGGGINIANDKLVPISDSLVSGNNVSATTTTGSAIAQGSGIHNGGLLALRNTTVSIGRSCGARSERRERSGDTIRLAVRTSLQRGRKPAVFAVTP